MRVNPTWTWLIRALSATAASESGIDVERTDRARPGLRRDDGAQAGSRADVDDTPAGHLVRMLGEVAGDPEPTGPRECPERYARVGLSQLRPGEARGDGDIVREMEAHAREIGHALEARRSPNERAAVGGRRTGHRVRLAAGQQGGPATVRGRSAKSCWYEGNMVGAAGFEPTTTSPPDWCATRLRHAPTEPAV